MLDTSLKYLMAFKNLDFLVGHFYVLLLWVSVFCGLCLMSISYAKFYDDIKTQESGLAPKRIESCLDCKFCKLSRKSDPRMPFCFVKSIGVTKDYYCSSWESK
jgi:hypothetical protein